MPTKFAMRLLAGTAVSALLTGASFAADAQARPFDIPQQDAATALQAFAMQSGRQVLFPYEAAKGKTAPEVKGDYSDEEVVALLAASAGLTVTADDGRTITLRPQFAQAAEAGGGSEVEALIVTAQKREEDIQDVPIAISAFTQESLERSQIAGGPDLMTQVPNMTFTKTNFSGYSIQIRGIGTQAVSATTDAAVAVAFNNTPFIRNRFFEQEFYDLQRVEVLRGPQGTLYGRNATAGVVNLISQKPTFAYEAKISADLANYKSGRLEGMLNIPLVEDKVGLRLAGAWTKREGYDTNSITGNQIDGRDLWSTRVSLRIEPNDRIAANLIWEHFQEDDDRLRSGKQLCMTDNVTEVGGMTMAPTFDDFGNVITVPVDNNTGLPGMGQGGRSAAQAFSQGCAPASLYSPDSFQTPNGPSLPYYGPLAIISLPAALGDPYASRLQSHDLRSIESTVDPQYRAKTDTVELQVSVDLGSDLTLASETAYGVDQLFSLEDYNRFNTAPGAWLQSGLRDGVITPGPDGGIFCDPQIGCSDRLVAVDLSTARSHQFSQEFRLSSDYGGAFNFSLGANFLRYDTEDKYYVFVNSLSIVSALSFNQGQGPKTPYVAGVTDNRECLPNGGIEPDPTRPQPILACTYVDPNPIGSLNDLGHNYFLSRNPYKLISYALFGEAYYDITDNLKITGGLRWTVDKKEAPRIPSWLLASNTLGYPVESVTRQEWSEPTGRLALDWRPQLSFTDETLVYVSYGRGYKAGGANPPPFGVAVYTEGENIIENSVTHPRTFAPEFVNAFEVGTKNTLLDGKLVLNADAFYYDYSGYQISQIVDRSAVNMNFDARIWGLELETEWRPLENLRIGFKGGYENTRIADGMQAIDLMDRTAGHDDWVVVRPFPSIPSNCIMPKWLFAGFDSELFQAPRPVDLGGPSGGNPGPCELAYLEHYDPVTDAPYVDLTQPHGPVVEGPLTMLRYFPDYPGWDPTTAPNNGEGFYKDLGGNELPNAPHFTATVTADYTLPLPSDWLMTLHIDLYYQSEAWARVFNTEGYDKLKAYTNVNLAAIFTNDAAGWKVMAYIKNVFDHDAITGAFLNSDDTDLTTNIFLNEPRLYGLRVTKDFDGGPWWTWAGPGHKAGEPYPLTVELGGAVQRWRARTETLQPDFIDGFSAPLNRLATAQERDLDWGDGREVTLTYRPAGLWSVSGAYRVGETNNGTTRLRGEEQTGSVCAFGPPLADRCSNPAYHFAVIDWADVAARQHEEHELVDFVVARDVGLGGLDRSSLRIGLRYGDFKSTSDASIDGIPDLYVPEGFFTRKYLTGHHHRYSGRLEAERAFEGAGPMLSWAASKRLLGDEEVGHLDVDWDVGGGVLFGTQTAAVTGVEQASYYTATGLGNTGWAPPVSVAPVKNIVLRRETSATVPTLDLSLGVSYEIQRLKLSTGYRWERYFDVLDAGFEERGEFDRTIDGPYVKLAIGFGG